MEKQELKKLIDVAAGRQKADLVIQNCRIVDVYSGTISAGSIAVSGRWIAGVGDYEGEVTVDAAGRYAAPGLIDSHIHVESSYLSPEQLGRLIVPCGTTTILADPHELCNICGLDGLRYMLAAAEHTALDVLCMMPSCVPATVFEHSGAVLGAADMEGPLRDPRVPGLGEFMDYPGVISASDGVLDKLLAAKRAGKVIDGHSPLVEGKALNAYAAPGICGDHECSTIREMEDRISRGLYVMMRQSSSSSEFETLLKGVTKENCRRVLLCCDDRQPRTILEKGHLNEHLRLCVKNGIDAVTAIRMATLNAAECFHLFDRGAIAPGLRADIVLFDDLTEFRASRVFACGTEAAREGKYLLPVQKTDITPVAGKFHVKDFSVEKLRLKLSSDVVHVINRIPGVALTENRICVVERTAQGEFVYNPKLDVVKMAVVERHQNTGNVAVALLGGYGIRTGAIALSIAHDSHNIIVTGTNDADMALAVEELIAQGGGIITVNGGQVLSRLPMPIGGVMSDQTGEWVDRRLTELHQSAHEILGVPADVEPVMALCFMSLAVIPHLRLTDMGLFDVDQFAFISPEWDGEKQ